MERFIETNNYNILISLILIDMIQKLMEFLTYNSIKASLIFNYINKI